MHQIEQLADNTGWLDWAESLLLFGPSAAGKTDLAAGISRSLIALDRSARCYTAATLVQEMQRAWPTTPWPRPKSASIAWRCW